jgi:hypothetical protein
MSDFTSKIPHVKNDEKVLHLNNEVSYALWTMNCVHLIKCVLDTTLCDKVYQRLATGRWFSPGPPVSHTNKTNVTI